MPTPRSKVSRTGVSCVCIMYVYVMPTPRSKVSRTVSSVCTLCMMPTFRSKVSGAVSCVCVCVCVCALCISVLPRLFKDNVPLARVRARAAERPLTVQSYEPLTVRYYTEIKG